MNTEKPRTPSKTPKKAKSQQDIYYSLTVEEKFAQQAKRNQIDAFLKKPSSSRGRERKLSVTSATLIDNIPPASPPPDPAEGGSVPNKINMADVIIAAAAAKTVKLKTAGDIGSFI